jgi:hypothetical protein
MDHRHELSHSFLIISLLRFLYVVIIMDRLQGPQSVLTIDLLTGIYLALE